MLIEFQALKLMYLFNSQIMILLLSDPSNHCYLFDELEHFGDVQSDLQETDLGCSELLFFRL